MTKRSAGTTSLGQLIRTARKNKGLTSYEVAERTGIMHRATVGRIEAGEITRPRPETLQRLAQVLDLNLDELLLTAGYVKPSDLPNLEAYLRTKHSDLPARAIAQLVDHFELIADKYGLTETSPEHASKGGAP